ncbi:MAG: hypothetical protein AB2L13_14830 [Spirochaetota bacterium]|jgi:hypothetical protein|nr:hypothetical protein [Spirochaetota bacterium]
MNDSIRRILIMHGGIVTSVGALSGLLYSLAISGDMPGSVQAWHLAHLQGILTGLLIIAVSSCVSHIRLDAGKSLVMAVCFIITGYCYAFGPIWGALFGVRGLFPEMPVANIVMFVSNTVASVSVLAGLGLLVFGAWRKRTEKV